MVPSKDFKIFKTKSLEPSHCPFGGGLGKQNQGNCLCKSIPKVDNSDNYNGIQDLVEMVTSQKTFCSQSRVHGQI